MKRSALDVRRPEIVSSWEQARRIGAGTTSRHSSVGTHQIGARNDVLGIPAARRRSIPTGTGALISRLRADISRLRAEVEETRNKLDASLEQQAALQAVVDALTEQVRVFHTNYPLANAPTADLDPFEVWIQSHRQDLQQFSGEFVAIHPDRGIVHHHQNERSFGLWVADLPADESAELLIGPADGFL